MTTTVYPGDPDWPSNYGGGTITGRFVDITATPITGSVNFEPTPTVLLNSGAKRIIIGRKVSVPLDDTGAFSVTLPASNDPDVNPSGWTYRVTENFAGGRSYEIEVKEGETRDLTEIVPVPASTGNAIVVGPPGPPGPPGPAGDDAPGGSTGVPDSGWRRILPSDRTWFPPASSGNLLFLDTTSDFRIRQIGDRVLIRALLGFNNTSAFNGQNVNGTQILKVNGFGSPVQINTPTSGLVVATNLGRVTVGSGYAADIMWKPSDPYPFSLAASTYATWGSGANLVLDLEYHTETPIPSTLPGTAV